MRQAERLAPFPWAGCRQGIRENVSPWHFHLDLNCAEAAIKAQDLIRDAVVQRMNDVQNLASKRVDFEILRCVTIQKDRSKGDFLLCKRDHVCYIYIVLRVNLVEWRQCREALPRLLPKKREKGAIRRPFVFQEYCSDRSWSCRSAKSRPPASFLVRRRRSCNLPESSPSSRRPWSVRHPLTPRLPELVPLPSTILRLI